MRLLDQVAQARPTPRRDGSRAFPEASDLKDLLAACATRFVLEPDVAVFARTVVSEQPELLAQSIDLLRMPDALTWLEWTEPAWNSASSFRVGLLVESDSQGRSGTITLIYEGQGSGPAVSPASFVFDFDACLSGKGDGVNFQMSHDSLNLASLFESIQGCVHPAWAKKWRAEGGDLHVARETQKLAQCLWMAPAILCAFCLLLGASSQFEQREMRHWALNRRREKRNKPPLLDHTEVTLRLFAPASAAGGGYGEPSDERRVRAHHVRGHLVRRGDTVFWRRPHLRGMLDASEPVPRMKRISFG